jgi:hypothetical protein
MVEIKLPGQPIKMGDLTQVGMVVKDIQESVERYWKLLGIGPWNIYTFAPPNLREATVRGKRVDYSMRLALCMAGPVQHLCRASRDERRGAPPYPVACGKHRRGPGRL